MEDKTTAGHDHAHGTTDGWPVPLMHPAVPAMIPGLEMLRPRVAPFVPARGLDADTLPLARARKVLFLRDGDSLSLWSKAPSR